MRTYSGMYILSQTRRSFQKFHYNPRCSKNWHTEGGMRSTFHLLVWHGRETLKKPSTRSYLQPFAQIDKWRVHPHNNKAQQMSKYSEGAGRITAALLHHAACTVFLQELYFYVFCDYKKYGNAWPVNVTNRKQTLPTAVNNCRQRMECFSLLLSGMCIIALCPLNKLGGKTIQAVIIHVVGLF